MAGAPRWKNTVDPGELRIVRKQLRARRKAKPRREGEFTEDQFKAAVKQRANGRCEAQTPVCTGEYAHAHHVGRRRGPDAHDPDHNGLGVCSACHGFIHLNPLVSYQRGWLRRANPRPGDWFYEVAS